MVQIEYQSVPEGGGSYALCLKLGQERLCSDPLPLTLEGQVAPFNLSPFLNLDEFRGFLGYGELPCFHTKVEGTIHFDYGSSIIDNLARKQYSPVGMNSGVYFPECHSRLSDGYVLLSSIDGAPVEEYVGLNPRNFAWHTVRRGTIDYNLVDVTILSGEWAYGRKYYYPTATHYHLERTSTSMATGVVNFEGYVERGTFPDSTKPSSFPTCNPVFSSKEPLALSGTLSRYEGGLDDVKYALRMLETEGVKDAIVLQKVHGEVLMDHLSCTADAMDAVADVHVLDSNNIENAVQSTDLTGMIPPLAPIFRIARDFKDPTTWAKSLGEIFLWYKYVAKPTCSDVKSMVEAARTESLQSLQQLKGGVYRHSSRESFGEWDTRTAARVSLHPYAADAVGKAINVLDNIGLLPTLARGWDLVPYSFVVDWFTNVSSCLASIDTNLFSHRYNIDEVTTSKKVWREGYMRGVHHYGSLTVRCEGVSFSLYRRIVSPVIPTDPRINLRGLTTTGHTLAGGALLVCNLG